MIRAAQSGDASQIAAIYNYYVTNSIATFEEEPIPDAVMLERLTTGIPVGPWFVSEVDGIVVGFSYAAPFASRSAYRRSVETTVYVAPGHLREGHGDSLCNALLQCLRDQGFHCAVALISLPNPSSVTLHEKFGFRKVGELSEVGWKFGGWIDVGYWQLML